MTLFILAGAWKSVPFSCNWELFALNLKEKFKKHEFYIPYLLKYRMTLHIRRPPFTILNFQENTNIHIGQVVISLIVYIFNILELNNHLS
jgi:hypothetical protein